MSVKIRLRRTGARNAVSYRVVAADTRAPRDGRFIETLGWYDPNRKSPNCEIDLARVDHWVSNGAQVSETVSSLVKKVRRGPVAEAEEAPVAEPEVAAEPVAAEAPAEDAEPAAEAGE